MKKGTMGTLAGIVIAAITIFILTDTLYADIIKPALYSETKRPSYQKFQELTSKIQELLMSENQIATDKMILEIEQEYNILGFDFDQTEIKTCFSIAIIEQTYNRPEDCEDGKACLCLYKEGLEDKNVLICKNFGKARFYSTLNKDTTKPGSFGCEKTRHPEKEFGEYEGIIIFGIGRFAVPGVDAVVDATIYKTLWGSQRIYIEKYADVETNHITISIEDDEVKERYKLINLCPDNSYSKCVEKHFDYVFIEKVDNNEQKFVCKFDQINNLCVKESIKDCSSGVIWKECVCGETAYDSGFCVDEKYQKNDLPTDYCYVEKIESCKKYKTENMFESEKYACIFNICSLDKNCYWEERWIEKYSKTVSGREGDYTPCETCPEQCDCDIYDENWLKEIDPCNCCV